MSFRQRKRVRTFVIALAVMILSNLPAMPAAHVAVAAGNAYPAVAPARQNDEPVPELELIYIGSEDERIRVLDPSQSGNSPLVEWTSPDGNWRAVDVGDFNADGDMEIVAIRGGGTGRGELGELAIYDPVVAGSGSGLDSINGIPWELLHRRDIPGRPTLVKAGNYDPNIPGDEIVYGFLVNEDVIVDDDDDKYRFTIIKSSIPEPDGRNWTDHISAKDEGVEWDGITSGDLGDGGADEIVLLEEDGGEINVFKIGSGWERIFDDGNDDRPYRSVALGDYYQGGYLEMVATRRASSSLATVFYYLYTPGAEDGLNFHAGIENEEKFQPYPRQVFLADVNGSGDDEAFFLRRDQSPRLFARNHGNDPMPAFEQELDGDDGYRIGVGGDFNGDGDEEIAVLRDDRMLIFDLNDNQWSRNEYAVGADTDYFVAGDLDAAGAVRGPQFALRDIDPPLISGTLEPNRQGPTVRYELINPGSDDTLFFNWDVSPNANWVEITFDKTAASEISPAGIFVTFNSNGLTPGTYSTNLVITGSNPDIVNNPFSIPVVLTVEPARLDPTPSAAAFIYFPCDDSATAREQRISLNGTSGVRYSAAVIERPVIEEINAALAGAILDVEFGADGTATFSDGVGNSMQVQVPAQAEISASATNIDWPTTSTWITATSQTGVVPDIITVGVDPAGITQAYQEAVLVIVGDESAGNNPTNVRLIAISTLCAADQDYLPYLIKR